MRQLDVKLKTLVSTVLILLLSACGGGGGGGGSASGSTDITKILSDSIQGVSYSTNSGTRLTNSQGQFTYAASDTTITFSIGNLTLRRDLPLSSIANLDIVLPTDLVGVARTDTSNVTVVKILQILQSLDDDGNPDNDINITPTVRASLTAIVDITDTSASAVTMQAGKILKSEKEVIDHFRKTLKNDLDLNVGLVFTNDRIVSTVEGNTAAITLIAEDDNNSAMTYSISAGDSAGFNNNAGVITFATVPDFETQQTYSFTATASNGSSSITQTIVINVVNVLENTLTINNQTRSVDENAAVDTNVGAVLDTGGNPSTYTITTGNTAGFFKIDNTGQIQVAQTGLDFETIAQYTLGVQIDKTDAASQSASITINITNVLEDTISINNQTRSVTENAAVDTNVGAVLDTGGNPSTYTITTGNTAGFFKIDNTGQIQVAQTGLDFESTAQYTLGVQIDKTDAASQSASITINITNVLDNILTINNQTRSVAENAAVDTNVGAVLDTGGNPSTYTITTGNTAGFFKIDNTGQIQVAQTGLDFETIAQYTLGVQIDKTDAVSQTASIVINVVNVLENTLTINNQTRSVTENAAVDTNVGAVLDTGGNPSTYTITAGNTNNAFKISNAGQIQVNNAVLDFETISSYALTVQIDKTDAASQSASITINITNVLDNILTISNQTRSVTENAAVNANVGAVLVTSGTPSTYTITTGNGAGFFKIDNTGQIQVTQTGLDFESTAQYTLGVQIDKTDAVSQTASIVINVVNVLENTLTINNQTRSVAENAAVNTNVGLVLVTTGNPSTYTITTGNTAGFFKIDNTGQIQVAQTGLDFETIAQYTLGVQIDKTDAASQSASITINLLDVIETATFTIPPIGNTSVAEDVTYTNPAMVLLGDAPIGTVVYSLTGTDADDFTVNTATGAVSLLNADFEMPTDSNTNNIYEVDLMATDADGNTDKEFFRVTITNVNDNAPTGLPSITGTAMQDQTLTANTSNIADADGLGMFNYQWQAAGVNISGANNSTLTLTSAEVGSIITVTVSYTDGSGATESISSTATGVVTSNNTPPNASDSVLNVNLLPQSQTAQTSVLVATDTDSTFTYSIVTQPLLGSVTINNASTGSYTYTTNNGQTTADNDVFTFEVSDGFSTDTANVTINLKTDPLYQHQWHLDNTGQANFATNGGIAGEDVNVDNVINDGLTGSGIIVAVIDEGLEIAHEDLSANIVVDGSHDFVDNDTDPTNPATDGDHGTSVAGLIASRGWNDIGGRGVAPFASLKGFNYLQTQSQTVANEIRALGAASYSNDVDIFNQSYGADSDDDFLIDSTIEAQFLSGVTTLRDGKGAIYIKSAGNGFTDFISEINCLSSIANNLSCQNANMDPTNTLPYNITIGALNARGNRSSYSTAGSSIWVSAPGGEDGIDDPAMMTTDQSGCSQGYVLSSISSLNAFDNGSSPHAQNPQCNYISEFNGTSSSVPVTSGAIALILEANPNLTWRDVKHILATTSDQIDSAVATTSIAINGVNYDAEPAWLTNAAGLTFHNYYGFGRVNVTNAVAAANAYTLGSLGSFTITAWIDSGAINQAIPDNSAAGITNAINGNNIVIEAVQIRINLAHTHTGELAIELTSPSGTKSVLFNTFNGFFGSADLDNMVLLSNAFYGENASGNWTIRVIDAAAADTGTLNNWSIRFFGH